MPLIKSARTKVYARGETQVVHSAGGGITTNVDVTAYGLPAITACVEKLTGITTTTPGSADYTVKVLLTSSTNLEIKTYSGNAKTLRIKWEIVKAEGTVQRGTETIAVNNNEVQSNITITSVNTDYAKLYCNGMIPATTPTSPVVFSVELTSATNIEAYAANAATINILGSWVVDGG